MKPTAYEYDQDNNLDKYQLEKYREILSQQNWTTEPVNSTQVQDWLGYQKSLTKKLQQQYSDFSVEMVQQGFFAKNGEDRTAWKRDVLLKGNGKTIIFAETEIPQETVENVAQDVLTLGETPIGLWLFPQNPVRTNLEWLQDKESGLYARRSVVLLKGYPLEIKELFLADFEFS